MKYVFGLLLILFSAQTIAKDRIYQGFFSGAIRGYDPVAYFTEGAAKRGDKKITYEYLDATWRFSSEEHKKLFIENPEKYIPQYGGYCAKAMSGDSFTKIDPKAWTIIDGKLYLNYSIRTRVAWRNEKDNLIDKADGHWTGHLVETFGEEPAEPEKVTEVILDSVDKAASQ